MTQAITLHSSTIRNSSFDLLNVPLEVLSIILVKMGGYAVDNVRNLSVSQEYRNHVLSAIPYVDELTTIRTTILRRFTGVKHLVIENGTIENSRYLNKRISLFNNITFLSIPASFMANLIEDDDTKLRMPNLRCLEITPTYRCSVLSINPKIVSMLKVVKIYGHWITNIDEVQTLETLEMSEVEIDIKVLNKLNISRLKLSYCDYLDDIKVLNIPSLRKLEIIDVEIDIEMLNGLNITELHLTDVEIVHGDTLNIPYLESLVLTNMYGLDVCNSERLKMLTLDNCTLGYGYYKMDKLETLNILRIRRYLNLDIVKSEFPNLRYLNIYSTSVKVCGNVPDNLLITYKV